MQEVQLLPADAWEGTFTFEAFGSSALPRS